MDFQLIEQIYEAALDPDLWPSVLAGIASACGAVSVTLVPGDDLAGLVISPGAEESRDAYARHWWRYDIIAQALFPQRRKGLFCDWHLIEAETRARHPFYQEFRRSFGLGDNLAYTAAPEPGVTFGLSLQMPARAPEHPDTLAVQRFTGLARHVSRAVQFTARMRGPEPQSAMATGLMQALTCGAACLDATGRVLLANGALLALAEDGLRVAGRRLTTAHASDQSRVDTLIQRSLQPSLPTGPDLVQVQRPSGRRPLLVCALPIAADPRRPFFHLDMPSCRALVTVIDPEAQVPARTEAALRALALSGAEARVAALIGRGLSPRDVAERLALTEGTVRTTLKQVFGKLGVNRQGELVRLVTQLSLLNGPS